VTRRLPGDPDVEALRAYLADEISLGKTADLLGLSRFELQDCFVRLGVPLRLGPATLEEAQAEIGAALKIG
jgi:predicted HTH domain antitoxin